MFLPFFLFSELFFLWKRRSADKEKNKNLSYGFRIPTKIFHTACGGLVCTSESTALSKLRIPSKFSPSLRRPLRSAIQLYYQIPTQPAAIAAIFFSSLRISSSKKFSPRFFGVLFVFLFVLLFEVLYVMELLFSAGSTVEIRRVNCCFPQPQLLKSATPTVVFRNPCGIPQPPLLFSATPVVFNRVNCQISRPYLCLCPVSCGCPFYCGCPLRFV